MSIAESGKNQNGESGNEMRGWRLEIRQHREWECDESGGECAECRILR